MIARDIPNHAAWTDTPRNSRTALGVAQRGSMLTGGPPSSQRVSVPVDDRELLIDLEEGSPAWFEPLTNKLLQLPSLAPGWDSYRAPRIDPACVARAIETAFLVMQNQTPPPCVVPTSCGGVQLEWHQGGMDLEIEIRSASQIAASCDDQQTGETWEEVVFDFTRVRRALRELTRRQR